MKKFSDDKESKISDRFYMVFVAACFAVMMLIFIRLSYEKEFWYDEMASIGYVASDISISQVLDYYMTIEATNLPVYPIILYCFYHLFGSHIMVVCMPAILFIMGASFYLIKTVRRWQGKHMALVMAVLCTLSNSFINRGGMTVRCYAMLVFAAAMALYYVYRYFEDEKHYILLTISLLLLVYSHYFGTLLFGLLGLYFLVQIIRKKANIKSLVCFILPGALFLPWFLMTMTATSVDVSSFWIAPPGIKSVVEALGFILGSSYIICAIYGVTFMVAVWDMIILKKRDTLLFLCIAVPVVVIGLIFVYSRFINPGGGLFENRYFMVLIPCCYLTIIYGISSIIEKIKAHSTALVRPLMALLGVIALITLGEMLYRIYEFGDVEQYARYGYSGRHIYEEGDVTHDDVLLITTYQDQVGRICQLGWYDYYFRTKDAEAGHVEIIPADEQEDVMDIYMDDVNRVYVFGDTELLNYNEEHYKEVHQATFYNYTIYEKID